MSRKFSLIPLAIIVIVWGVWASSSLFPDSPGTWFSARPSTPWTLAYVLDTYFNPVDGTAHSGIALGGTGANWYLRWSTCAASDAVWKGIDASGNPICKWPPLAFAEIYEWAMSVNGVVQPIGTKLREWDRIQTNATQTGTIKFYNNPGANPTSMGDSIARLGTGTSVYIDRGDTLGTLALVNLEDGLLWWRVLSSTGIDFGGGGVIAGVRGTSLSLKEPFGNQFQFTIPHSQHPTEAAIMSTKIDTAGANARTLGVLWQVLIYSGMTSIPTAWVISDLSTLYDMDPWVRSNTLADIKYMKSLPQTPTITAELAATLPNDEPKRYALCSSTQWYWYEDGKYGCVLAYANADTNYDLKWSQDMSWEIIAKRSMPNTNFYDWGWWDRNWNISSMYSFRSIEEVLQAWVTNPPNPTPNWYTTCPSPNNPNKYCNFMKDGLALNYSTLHIRRPASPVASIVEWNNFSYPKIEYTDWLYNPAHIVNYGNPDIVNPSLMWVTLTGQYLTYVAGDINNYIQTWNSWSYSSLAGKTITIELGGVVGSNLPAWWTKAYIADFGSEKWFVSNGKNCAGVIISWKALCKVWVTGESPTYVDSLVISLPITSTPTQMIIGNNSTDKLNPIWTSIQKIIIQ